MKHFASARAGGPSAHIWRNGFTRRRLMQNRPAEYLPTPG
jgi:hypothetical protein